MNVVHDALPILAIVVMFSVGRTWQWVGLIAVLGVCAILHLDFTFLVYQGRLIGGPSAFEAARCFFIYGAALAVGFSWVPDRSIYRKEVPLRADPAGEVAQIGSCAVE